MLHYFQNAGDWAVLVILFGLCIFVHELGHFLAARAFGMVIETFSMGFGPAIWKKRIKKMITIFAASPMPKKSKMIGTKTTFGIG